LEDNIKTDLREMCYQFVDWIEVVLVNKVINLRVHSVRERLILTILS
jgi:hypothetical protein